MTFWNENFFGVFTFFSPLQTPRVSAQPSSRLIAQFPELFGPEDSLKIVVKEDLTGVNVRANGHFEFMLKRNNKRICIVRNVESEIAGNGSEFSWNGSCI